VLFMPMTKAVLPTIRQQWYRPMIQIIGDNDPGAVTFPGKFLSIFAHDPKVGINTEEFVLKFMGIDRNRGLTVFFASARC